MVLDGLRPASGRPRAPSARVQLRGHNQAPGRIWHRIHDYVEDVRQATAQFPDPPVLVGHSMGGLVVQRYLERYPASAAVLMASTPAEGTIRAVCRIGAYHPVLLLKASLLLSLRPLVGNAALARERFFTPDTPQAVVDSCLARLQDESYPAFLETIVRPPRPRLVRAPVLVLGAERDGFFTADDIRRTAHAYRTEAEIFPRIGHNMMLDDGWPLVADRIDGWIRETLAVPHR